MVRWLRFGGVVCDTASRDAVGIAAREPAATRRDLLLGYLVRVRVRFARGRRPGDVLVPLPSIVDLVVVRVSRVARHPGRRRLPAPGWVSLRLLRRDGGRGRVGGLDGLAPRPRGLAPCPVLERRADGERRREAVRLLVRQGARSRVRLGIAAMTVVGAGRTLVAIVLERDEGAGRCTVGGGEPSLGHLARMIPALTRPTRPPALARSGPSSEGRASRRS